MDLGYDAKSIAALARVTEETVASWTSGNSAPSAPSYRAIREAIDQFKKFRDMDKDPEAQKQAAKGVLKDMLLKGFFTTNDALDLLTEMDEHKKRMGKLSSHFHDCIEMAKSNRDLEWSFEITEPYDGLDFICQMFLSACEFTSEAKLTAEQAFGINPDEIAALQIHATRIMQMVEFNRFRSGSKPYQESGFIKKLLDSCRPGLYFEAAGMRRPG